MKSVAIMQPYFFPYLGYFALLSRVETFVVLDNVQMIRRGWVHRNFIPGSASGEKIPLVIPLKRAPQKSLIWEIEMAPDTRWKEKLSKTLKLRYSRAPYFGSLMELMNPVWDANDGKLAELLLVLLKNCTKYLGLNPEIISASESFSPPEGDREEKIIHLCQSVQATEYWNLPGGRGLYREEIFSHSGIQLQFVPVANFDSLQRKWKECGPWSILHVIAHYPPEDIRSMLETLLSGR